MDWLGRLGHLFDTTDFASAMHEDRVVQRMPPSECLQPNSSIVGAAEYAKLLQKLTQLYQLDLRRAVLRMKKMVTQIEEALISHSRETVLDDPEKFQALVWSFGKEMRAGIQNWCEDIDGVFICE